MCRIVKYIFTTICAFALYYNANAQLCESKHLESIYEKLPSKIKEDGGGVVNGFEVDIQQNKEGIITTLGINLPIFEGDSTNVSQFIRRYFLDLILAEDEQEIKNVLDRNRSKLFYNGAEYQKGPYWDLTNGLTTLNQTISFNLNRDSLNYQAVWTDGSDNSLALDFPANAQIILSKDKLELELELESLFNLPRDKSPIDSIPTNPSLYTQIVGEVYAKQGASFIIDSLSNTTYYTKSKSGNFEVVYSPDMTAPSLVNMLLLRTKRGNDTFIRVEQKMYGNEIRTFDITTNTLRSFCEANGFRSYVGIKEVTNQSVEAIVILHNTELNYIHMLHVATDNNSLFGSRNRFMSAQLNSYIPFDNVVNLYQENNDNEQIKL